MHPASGFAPGQQDALATQGRGQPGKQVSLDGGPRVVQVEHPVSRPVGLRAQRPEQSPVDPVTGHQLGGLGRQSLRFLGRATLIFSLSEQLANAVKQVSLHWEPPLEKYSNSVLNANGTV